LQIDQSIIEQAQVDKATCYPKPSLPVRILKRALVRIRILLINLRCPGLKIGNCPQIDFSRVRFDTWPGPVIIGNACIIRGGDITGHVIMGERVKLINPSRIGGSSQYKVLIGDDTWIAPNAYIVPLTHAYKRKDITIAEQGSRGGDIIIGEDCWIGTNVVISPGITIGNGAVIGANSVVTKDIPEYAIAVGAPAKVISYRE